MTTTTKKAESFTYEGIVVTPTYKSKNGTGRQCATVQGWTFRGPRGEIWAPSAKAARDEIYHYKYVIGLDKEYKTYSKQAVDWARKTFYGIDPPEADPQVRFMIEDNHKAVEQASSYLSIKYGEGWYLISPKVKTAMLHQVVFSRDFFSSLMSSKMTHAQIGNKLNHLISVVNKQYF